MSLIKESHNTLFKELFDELAGDIGHSITVVTRLTGVECSYCYKDKITGRSSGKAKINWATHPSYDNVGLTCPECFTADNLVLTSVGYKKISEVNIGDLVLTHTGNFKPVINKFIRQYDGDIIKVRTTSYPEYIECTPNHKFLYLQGKYCHRKSMSKACCFVCNGQYCPKRKDLNYNYFWEKIENFKNNDFLKYGSFNITNDFLLKDIYPFKRKMKKNKEITELIKDKDLYYIIGLYIAEGYCVDRGISFAFHINETNYINFVKNFFEKYNFVVRIDHGSENGVSVNICSIKLSRFFEYYCGHLAENKHIPYELLTSNKIDDIFQGIFNGDGSVAGINNINGLSITSTSKELIMQLCLVCQNKKWLFHIAKIKGGFKHNCNHRDAYTLNFQKIYNKSYTLFYKEKDLFVRIKNIKKEQYSGLVYNLEVEEDHSYTVNNLIVSNCHGKGSINTETNVTVNNVMIEDISGTQFIAGKFSFFDSGTRKLMGKLADILVDKNDLNSATIFDTATEIIVYGEKHKVLRCNRSGLKQKYIYEIFIEKIAGI